MSYKKPYLNLDLQFFGDKSTDNTSDAQKHVDAAQKAWKQARDIMDEYKGKEMPQEKEAEVDKWLDEVDKEQKRAERVQREGEAKRFSMNRNADTASGTRTMRNPPNSKRPRKNWPIRKHGASI